MKLEGTSGESVAATDVGAGLAPAQTNEPAQTTQTGEPAQTGEAAQPAQPAQTAQTRAYNFDEIHAIAEKGGDIPDEFYDQYEKDLLSGKRPGRDKASLASGTEEQSQPDTSQEQANADGGKEQAQELQTVMAQVGAKTPQEIPAKVNELRNAFSQASERAKYNERTSEALHTVMLDIAAGKQEAFDYFKKITGKDFPTQPVAQQPAQAAKEANPFLLSDEEIEKSLDPDLGRLFNGRLQNMQAHFEEQLKKFGERISKVDQYEEFLAAEQYKASVAHHQSAVTDILLKIAEMDEFENLKSQPVRAFIEEYVSNPDKPPREELKDLLEVARLYGSKKADTIEDALKIHFYPQTKAKIAQAKIEATKSATGAQAKPTVGVHGTTQNGSSAAAAISDETAEKMAAGEIEMPEEYFDEDGVPTPKMPANLKQRLFKIAAA